MIFSAPAVEGGAPERPQRTPVFDATCPLRTKCTSSNKHTIRLRDRDDATPAI